MTSSRSTTFEINNSETFKIVVSQGAKMPNFWKIFDQKYLLILILKRYFRTYKSELWSEMSQA